MINLENIHSLTDFRRHTKDYVEKLKASKAPFILTVNGEASLVVQDATAFQALLSRLEQLEKELESIKIESLRRDIQIGLEQSARGEVAPLDIEAIKRKGRTLLDQQTK